MPLSARLMLELVFAGSIPIAISTLVTSGITAPALVVLSKLSLPFLNIIENVSESSRSGWCRDGLVRPVQLCLTPRPNREYNLAPCVESIAWLDIVEGHVLLPV